MFNIENYPGNYVMHCKTREEVESFCKYLNSRGFRTCTCSPYRANYLWDMYGETAAFSFNKGCYCEVEYYRKSSENFTILEWEDFMNHTFTKADLKNGDIVLQRSGVVQIYIESLNVFVVKDGGWNDVDKFNDDLTHQYGDRADIVAVRRPREKSDCIFGAFDLNYGELVYDRERDTVVEMTMEEICAALGKNIKIVKEK